MLMSGKAIQVFFNILNLVFPHRFCLSVSFIDMQSCGLLPLLHYLWVNGLPSTHAVLQRPKAVPEGERESQSLCFNRGGDPTMPPLIYSHSNNSRVPTRLTFPVSEVLWVRFGEGIRPSGLLQGLLQGLRKSSSGGGTFPSRS